MQIDEYKKIIKSGNESIINQLAQQFPTWTQILDGLDQGVLHWAAAAGHVNVINMILRAGVPVDAVDKYGTTPLMSAAMNGKDQAVSALIDAHANVNAQQTGAGQKTVLMQAIDSPAIAKMLIDAGALTDTTDLNGKTAATMLDEQSTRQLERDTRNAVQQAKTPAIMPTLFPRTSKLANNVAATLADLNLSSLPSLDAANKFEPSMDQEGDIKDTAAEVSLTEMPQAPLPEMIEKWDAHKQEAYRKLMSLGCEDVTLLAKEDVYNGRDTEVNKLLAMLGKEQNPMMVGASGVGKSVTAVRVAEKLGEQGKVMIKVPSSLLRGNKYAGSVNENIQKWLPSALAISSDIVVFIDDSQVLTTGKTSSDNNDTPLQVLKDYLGKTSAKRLLMMGAMTEKAAEAIEDDETAKRIFSNYHIAPMTKEETAEILKSSGTFARMEKQGYELDSKEAFDALIDQSLPLLESFLFNQSFPKKAFEFIDFALRDTPVSDLDEDKVEAAFSTCYSIPSELVRGEIDEGSVYDCLEDRLNEHLIGQKHVIAEVVTEVHGSVLLTGAGARKPISFMFLGPSGTGKTELSERLARELNLPIVGFSMGEYKLANQVPELLEKLSAHLVKNFSGIILIDEIEKANPQILDMLLNLLDKGAIGSGSNKVHCGSQIVIGTSNIGAKEMVRIKKGLLDKYNHSEIDEAWMQQSLVNYGWREELVYRFTKILDFNPISTESALVIGKKAFAKNAKGLKENKDIGLTFTDEFIEHQVLSEFDDRLGARGVLSTVADTVKRLIKDKGLRLKMRRGTNLVVSDTPDALVVTIEEANGNKSEARIVNQINNKKAELDQILASFDNVIKGATSRAQSAVAPNHQAAASVQVPHRPGMKSAA